MEIRYLTLLPLPATLVCVGAWLSPVEHRVWDAGVVGSNPSAPTTNL